MSPDGSTVFVAGGVTVAYDALTGAVLWAAPTGTSLYPPFKAAVSPDGSMVFVTGTVAYNATTGATLWARTYTGPVSGDSQGLSVTASPNGSAVFVTGGSPGGHNGIDTTTIAYRP